MFYDKSLKLQETVKTNLNGIKYLIVQTENNLFHEWYIIRAEKVIGIGYINKANGDKYFTIYKKYNKQLNDTVLEILNDCTGIVFDNEMIEDIKHHCINNIINGINFNVLREDWFNYAFWNNGIIWKGKTTTEKKGI